MPSTAIRFFDYKAETRELRVTFTTGRRYVYLDVPQSLVDDFKAAVSKGAFFNTRIRDHFDYRELQPVTR